MRMLAATEVPETVLPIEEEPALLKIQEDIKTAKQELAAAKADKPVYEIPSRYLDPSELNEEEEALEDLITDRTPQEPLPQQR